MKRAPVKQSMSKELSTISWNCHMSEAAEILEEKRFRHLPVTDDMGIIVGILSDRDINRAMNPNHPGFAADSTVSDYMSWPVITVDQNLPLKDAAQGMIDEKISAFLVTDESKMIIGIITSEDLLKAFVHFLSEPNTLTKISYSPIVGEILREAQAAGI